METMLMIGITLVLFYVILILPMQLSNRRRRRELRALVEGDEVVTFGGLVGKVVQMGEEELTLEVSRGVQVRVVREAIRRRRPPVMEVPVEPPAGEGD